jgi:hypothetical protein
MARFCMVGNRALEPIIAGLNAPDGRDQDLSRGVLQFFVAERIDIERKVRGKEQHRLGTFRLLKQLLFPGVAGKNLVNIDENALGTPALDVDEPLPDREGVALLLAFVENEEARQGNLRSKPSHRYASEPYASDMKDNELKASLSRTESGRAQPFCRSGDSSGFNEPERRCERGDCATQVSCRAIGSESSGRPRRATQRVFAGTSPGSFLK